MNKAQSNPRLVRDQRNVALKHSINTIPVLTLMLWWVIWPIDTKWCKTLKHEWKPWHAWLLIWEYSARVIQWLPTWQGLDVFQKSLSPCALDESTSILSIGRVNEVVKPNQGCPSFSFLEHRQSVLEHNNFRWALCKKSVWTLSPVSYRLCSFNDDLYPSIGNINI